MAVSRSENGEGMYQRGHAGKLRSSSRRIESGERFMNSGTLVMPAENPAARTLRVRVGAVVASFALVFAMLVMVQDRADAAPVSNGAVAAAVAPQINIQSIVCPGPATKGRTCRTHWTTWSRPPASRPCRVRECW